MCIPHYYFSRRFAAGLTSRPHYDQSCFELLTWIASPATGIDFQPQRMLFHIIRNGAVPRQWIHQDAALRDKSAASVRRSAFVDEMKFRICSPYRPASLHVIIVVIHVYAGAAVFYMSVPARRNIVADADFIRINVIADADRSKAPAGGSVRGSWPRRPN